MIRTVEIPTVGIEVVKVKSRAPEWALNIIKYIDTNEVPAYRWKAKKIRNRAAHCTKVKRLLYRRGYFTPFLRCFSFEEAQYVLVEVHEGICSHHLGGKVLASKVMRVGYYLPYALQDAKEYMRKCKKCQEY